MIEPSASLKRGNYLLNTDGGNSGNRLGRAAIGALLRTRRLVTVAQISKEIGPATHNEAEYQALIEGLKLARDHGVQRIRVYMDSELVVDQVNRVSAVRQAHLRELYQVASSLLALFESIRISWVPRGMNAEADRLVRDALGADEEGNPIEAVETAPEESAPKPKAKKSPEWKSWPDAEKAEYLLAHQTLSDSTWTTEKRLKGEKRDAFIRRILLGEGETGGVEVV